MSQEQQTACEDLKAFERRLTEVLACLQPSTFRWRFLLAVAFGCTIFGAYDCMTDAETYTQPFVQCICSHLFFTFSIILLSGLFLCGIHKKVMAPTIIMNRTRQVLNDFNMSCDETGKLILKPRPTLT